MAVPRYYWRDSGTVGTLSFMARLLFLFCVALGGLFAIFKPVEEAVIQPFAGLLAALGAIILPFEDTDIAQGRILRDATTNFAVSIEAGCNGV